MFATDRERNKLSIHLNRSQLATYISSRIPEGYQITDRDALLLGQMLLGEAGEGGSKSGDANGKGGWLLWCYMNRWHFTAKRNKRSFFDIVQLHSQPVNPGWRQGGKFWNRQMAKNSNNSAVQPRREKRRARIQNYKWSTLPASVGQLVQDFRQGKVSYPAAWKNLPETVVVNGRINGSRKPNDFASMRGLRKRFPHGIAVPGEESKVQPDWFFERKGSHKKKEFIIVRMPQDVSSSKSLNQEETLIAERIE